MKKQRVIGIGLSLIIISLGVLGTRQIVSAKNTTHLSGRERAAQAKLNRTNRTASVPKSHKRTIPGRVSNINLTNKTFDLIKGNKTYHVDASAVGVVFVNRKWQPIANGINDIQNGHKVTVKGTVTGTDVVATGVRDVSLPVRSASATD